MEPSTVKIIESEIVSKTTDKDGSKVNSKLDDVDEQLDKEPAKSETQENENEISDDDPVNCPTSEVVKSSNNDESTTKGKSSEEPCLENSELKIEMCKKEDLPSESQPGETPTTTTVTCEAQHPKLKPMMSVEAKEDDGDKKEVFISSLNLILKKHDSKLAIKPMNHIKDNEATEPEEVPEDPPSPENKDHPGSCNTSVSSTSSCKDDNDDVAQVIEETTLPPLNEEKQGGVLKGNVLIRRKSMFASWDRYFSQVTERELDCFESPEDQEINGEPKQVHSLSEITNIKKAKRGFMKTIYYLSIKRTNQPKLRLGFYDQSEQERWYESLMLNTVVEEPQHPTQDEITPKRFSSKETPVSDNLEEESSHKHEALEDIKNEEDHQVETTESEQTKPKKAFMKNMGVSLNELQSVKLKKSPVRKMEEEKEKELISEEESTDVQLRTKENKDGDIVAKDDDRTSTCSEDKRGSQTSSVIRHAESIEIVFNEPPVEFGKQGLDKDKNNETDQNESSHHSNSETNSTSSYVEFPHVTVEIKDTESTSDDELSDIYLNSSNPLTDNISVISATTLTSATITTDVQDAPKQPSTESMNDLNKNDKTIDPSSDDQADKENVSPENKTTISNNNKIEENEKLENNTEFNKNDDVKITRRASCACTDGSERKGKSKFRKIFRRMTSDGNFFDRVLKRRSFRKSIDISDKESKEQDTEPYVKFIERKEVNEDDDVVDDCFYKKLENNEKASESKTGSNDNMEEAEKNKVITDTVNTSTDIIERRLSEPFFNSEDNLIIDKIVGRCQETKDSNWSISAQTSNFDNNKLVEDFDNSNISSITSDAELQNLESNRQSGDYDKNIQPKIILDDSNVSSKVEGTNNLPEDVIQKYQEEMPSNLTLRDKSYPSQACSSSRSSLVLPEHTVYEEDEEEEQPCNNGTGETNGDAKNSSQHIDDMKKIDQNFLENEGESDDYFPSYGSVPLRQKDPLEIPPTELRTSGINDLKNYLADNDSDMHESDYISGVNRLGSSSAVEKLKTKIK